MSFLNVIWGLFGVFVICGISYLFSNNRKKVSPRLVLSALAFEVIFAWFVLSTKIGSIILKGVTDFVNVIISYANEGINFVFGGLYTEESGISFVVAFNVLPMIIFFASLIAIAYYLNIMPFIFKYVGGLFSKLFTTTKRESIVAAANIFLGQTESPLVVKPYLPRMSVSEIFAVMTCGLASVAGTMLASYALLGVELEYLLAASFMAAPSGLIIAKLFYPETEDVQEEKNIQIAKENESTNIIDAAANGARNGLQIALIVGATLIAFVALIYMVNGFIGYIGGWFGVETSLQQMLGYVIAPLAFAIGIPWDEAIMAGSLIGEKLVLTEFVAYINFMDGITQFSEKSVMVITFALCGFANFTSMATLASTLSSLNPERQKLFMKLSLKSVFAGALASMLSAAIAGMFFI
ncbi:NupC/NupG family nucleoside CNT transporter [Virgibacillus necropolis]|uniref:NupC/NupG family nucleoside CNT transporter n=1 Tax=Virgibacillus necropolis TaxID=163877 RepID=A0A221MFD7_9BACI|nr:NupC/NupG family nucleoside CNT transporter [Virgibacillus necropolis]ASN06357.1 NupC/NupG family nucleoside CNT transporter [Virgibacillus necropolis]